MGNDYAELTEIAAQAGFKSLTALQSKCFGSRAFFDLKKWLFVIGATSSGKTLVALGSYFYEHARAAEQGRDYKMLFAVPYRALASQKIDELNDLNQKLGLHLRILQSTSESNLDDSAIIHGDTDIAVIINEKIFMFAANDSEFLGRYDLIVLDEVALNQDIIRGIKTDLILLQAMRHDGLRVIALGTPFYNGRGRLLSASSSEQKNFGCVYPLLDIDRNPAEREFFIELQKKIRTPEITRSKFLNADDNYLAFYVLSLFSGTGGAKNLSLSVADVKKVLQRLPLPPKAIELENPIGMLLGSKLLRQVIDTPHA